MSRRISNSFLLSYLALTLLAASFAGIEQSAADVSESTAVSGYASRDAAEELRLEQQFAAIPSADEAKRQHKFLTSEPHPAGSARNNELARYIADLWKQQGWEDVVIHRYDVLQSSPREVSLEMVAPVTFKAGLREDA